MHCKYNVFTFVARSFHTKAFCILHRACCIVHWPTCIAFLYSGDRPTQENEWWHFPTHIGIYWQWLWCVKRPLFCPQTDEICCLQAIVVLRQAWWTMEAQTQQGHSSALIALDRGRCCMTTVTIKESDQPNPEHKHNLMGTLTPNSQHTSCLSRGTALEEEARI